MESLSSDLCLKIFCLLDHQNLAAAQQVCRKWKVLASDNMLWSNLFKERWGTDHATFYAPPDSKPWKDVFQVQDRCDRVGLGLSIIREGEDYYLVQQGEIQRHLGSRRQTVEEGGCETDSTTTSTFIEEGCLDGELSSSLGILDRIIFFIGDLQAASVHAKRSRLL